MTVAFQYIIDNHGIDTEESYEYEGHQGSCHYNPNNRGATITSYKRIPSRDERTLAAAIATTPVAVGVDASNFQHYRRGIFRDQRCSKQRLNHGVLAVGYGPSYYIIKNSWSTRWGDRGYMKLARGQNTCGVATDASYPIA